MLRKSWIRLGLASVVGVGVWMASPYVGDDGLSCPDPPPINDEPTRYEVSHPTTGQQEWSYRRPDGNVAQGFDYGYRETGLASWYGGSIHGRTTASGEVFDQWALTAAHRTLPLGSCVRVVSLDNGRSVVLRINDRGPFTGSDRRIIDVSRQAARILGFEEQGLTPVRIELIADTRHRMAASLTASRQP